MNETFIDYLGFDDQFFTPVVNDVFRFLTSKDLKDVHNLMDYLNEARDVAECSIDREKKNLMENYHQDLTLNLNGYEPWEIVSWVLARLVNLTVGQKALLGSMLMENNSRSDVVFPR